MSRNEIVGLTAGLLFCVALIVGGIFVLMETVVLSP